MEPCLSNYGHLAQNIPNLTSIPSCTLELKKFIEKKYRPWRALYRDIFNFLIWHTFYWPSTYRLWIILLPIFARWCPFMIGRLNHVELRHKYVENIITMDKWKNYLPIKITEAKEGGVNMTPSTFEWVVNRSWRLLGTNGDWVPLLDSWLQLWVGSVTRKYRLQLHGRTLECDSVQCYVPCRVTFDIMIIYSALRILNNVSIINI